MVAAARARGVPAEVRRWEDLEAGGFATVLCLGNSLAHARDRVAALRGMAAALAPGGRLVLTSRNWEAERARGSRVEHEHGLTRTWTIPSDPAAALTLALEAGGVAVELVCWPYSHEQLDADLRAAGLEPESSTWAPGSGPYVVTARAASGGSSRRPS